MVTDSSDAKLKKAYSEIENGSSASDIESWNIILKDIKNKSIDKCREVYEKLLIAFPNQGKFWKSYIDAEMKAKNYENVEKLFQRSLIKILNIDLWICYLSYIKEAKANLPSYKEKLAQAYEFAIEKVGLDYKSQPIWQGQIDFLKNIEAVGSYAENQRISAIRKVYHRGCLTPHQNMEQFWRDYLAFEQSINPLIAKKLTDELSKDYMNARRALKEMEAITRGLIKGNPPTPMTGNINEIKQIDIWKRYLRWERNNPLNYEDKNMVIKRVVYAYDQALLVMSYSSELWLEAGLYLSKMGQELIEQGETSAGKILLDKASDLYTRATSTFFQTSLLLHFVQADFEEMRGNWTKVEIIFEKLIDLKTKLEPDDVTLVYIQYKRFSRRHNGIKGARLVFKKAREDSRTKYHVFTESAHMEYYCNKDKNIALKIFELGLKRFATEIDYLKDYIDFSLSLNDDNNTRVLFERLISLTHNQISTQHAEVLWNLFLRFEMQVGDLNIIQCIERRKMETFLKANAEDPEAYICGQLIEKFSVRELLPCSTLDCKLMHYIPSILLNSTYTASAKLRNINFANYSNDTGHLLSDNDSKINPISSINIMMPDTSQMIPFKPFKHTVYGDHMLPIPGGLFAYPPAIEVMLTMLPQSNSFNGPYVSVDNLMGTLFTMDLEKVNSSNISYANTLPTDPMFDPKSMVPTKGNNPSEMDDDLYGLGSEHIINDIYRLRQQQKRIK